MEPFLGQIQAFGFNFAPRGWAQCQGQLLAINTNTALFSLLGTTYGGNGQTTFALPDFRGRTMVGQGQGPGLSPYSIGQQGGHEAMTLTTNNLPAHTHIATAQPHTHAATATATLYAERIAGNSSNPSGNMMGAANNMFVAPATQQNVAMASDAITAAVTNADTVVNVTNSVTGNSSPFDNLSPYLCVSICIATEGIFPPRN
jgi:microcystin-dependent protein